MSLVRHDLAVKKRVIVGKDGRIGRSVEAPQGELAFMNCASYIDLGLGPKIALCFGSDAARVKISSNERPFQKTTLTRPFSGSS